MVFYMSYVQYTSSHQIHEKINSIACVYRCRIHAKCVCKLSPSGPLWMLMMGQSHSTGPACECVWCGGTEGVVLTESSSLREIEVAWIKRYWADKEKICQIPPSEPQYLFTLGFFFCPVWNSRLSGIGTMENVQTKVYEMLYRWWNASVINLFSFYSYAAVFMRILWLTSLINSKMQFESGR